MEVKGRREGHPILKEAEERKIAFTVGSEGAGSLQKTVLGHLKSINET